MKAVSDLIQQARVLDLGPLPAPRLALNATVYQALQMLVRARRGAVVVLDGMRPVGIFTERDVVYRLPDGLFTSREQRRHMPLRDIMSAPAVTVERHQRLADAVSIMVEHEHRQVVVTDRDGNLRGLLTTGDLVQFVLDQFPEETLHLPPRLRQEYHHPGGA